jgi:type II secretory pathway component GspD/PulD (secretin)
MKRILPTLIVILGAITCQAQNASPAPAKSSNIETVSVSAKGLDVRSVLSDLFTQAKKSFVIEPNTHFALYLSLNDMEFEEALNLILKTASLKYQVQNGIYFITKDKGASAQFPQPVTEKSNGKLAPITLRKKLTIAFHKADIRTVFSELTGQTGVMIEVDAKVPNYKVDAVMKDVTLKYALQNICRPAGLTYRFTENLSLSIIQAPSPVSSLVKIEPTGN